MIEYAKSLEDFQRSKQVRGHQVVSQDQESTVEVTILLPAYNEAQSIGTTISRIRELHPDFEVLVIDDGSTDNTLKVAIDAGANVNFVDVTRRLFPVFRDGRFFRTRDFFRRL